MLSVVFYELFPIHDVFIHYFISFSYLFQHAPLINLEVDVVVLVEENLIVGFVCPNVTIAQNVIPNHILPVAEHVHETHLFFLRQLFLNA